MKGLTSVCFDWCTLSNDCLEAQHYTGCCFHLCRERGKGERKGGKEKRGERRGWKGEERKKGKEKERERVGPLHLRMGPEFLHLRHLS